MALFNFKKDEKAVTVSSGKKPKATSKVKKLSVTKVTPKGEIALDAALYANVLVRPRVTEKAAGLSEKGVYVFDIQKNANKRDVSNAVKAFYNVTPERVRVIPVPAKEVFVRGKVGTKKGGKKAYVYLKEGDKIEIV